MPVGPQANAGSSRWRPVERLYKTAGEQEILKKGAWRTSAILEGPALERNTAYAKDWGDLTT